MLLREAPLSLRCMSGERMPSQAGMLDEIESFRLIMVKSQLGLLQEGVLFIRLRDIVRIKITPGQSGYLRDVADAHLLLHELSAAAIQDGRPLCAIFGDLQKAFPRTWRQGLLCSLHARAGIRDGCFALLSSILAEDNVHVHFNGSAAVLVHQGISEGGTIGPLTFPIYMEELTQELLAAGMGVGVGIQMPGEWQEHVWSGAGSPHPGLVQRLRDAIRGGGALPTPATLAAWPQLEASALAALDGLAPRRLVAILHADDPVLLASSWGNAQALWVKPCPATAGLLGLLPCPTDESCLRSYPNGPNFASSLLRRERPIRPDRWCPCNGHPASQATMLWRPLGGGLWSPPPRARGGAS